MKKIIIILIVIITLIIIFLIWNNQSRKIGMINYGYNPKAVVVDTQEGKLETGRDYVYFGTGENSFDFQVCIKKLDLIFFSDYTMEENVKTPKEAAEVSQEYFGLNLDSADNFSIQVFYDDKLDSWILISKIAPEIMLIGDRIGFLVIKRDSNILQKYIGRHSIA